MSTELQDKENISDLNLFKKNKKLEKDNAWNDIIVSLVLGYKKTDEELKELAKICSKEKDEG